MGQQAIREAFATSTLLTIAHRLHTVMDYHKILVMSHGRVAEYDQPHALLQDPRSQLSALAASGSRRHTSFLSELAKSASIASFKTVCFLIWTTKRTA